MPGGGNGFSGQRFSYRRQTWADNPHGARDKGHDGRPPCPARNLPVGVEIDTAVGMAQRALVARPRLDFAEHGGPPLLRRLYILCSNIAIIGELVHSSVNLIRE